MKCFCVDPRRIAGHALAVASKGARPPIVERTIRFFSKGLKELAPQVQLLSGAKISFYESFFKMANSHIVTRRRLARMS